ncbi:MAG: peptidoglycan editing factor PgeF [Muribaculaceae bacterium]|nr:peptidoglycan editing factor PgeF [Muribaculaceae bacterium]
MTLDELKFNSDAKDIRVIQTQRGEVNATNSFSQWNLCHYTGDEAQHVFESRLELCRQLGIDYDHLIMPRQVHSCRVTAFDEKLVASPSRIRKLMLDDVDALVTTVPGVCIGVNTADCVPIALTDPTNGVIAIAHAGWRGTVGRIAEDTVKVMEAMGAKISNILATMGVSICQDCFEVGDEVVKAFEDAGFDMSLIMHRNASTGKAHINLQEANRQVLIAAGVPPSNITLPEHCSRCESDRYFSARRLGINSGRTFTGIVKYNV